MPGEENQIAVNVDKLLKAFNVQDADFAGMKKALKGDMSPAGEVGTGFSNAEEMMKKLDDAGFGLWGVGHDIIDAIKAASEKAGGGSITMAEAKKKKKNLRIKISGYS
jgi:hypothetical protein